jgi:hypothetical protein
MRLKEILNEYNESNTSIPCNPQDDFSSYWTIRHVGCNPNNNTDFNDVTVESLNELNTNMAYFYRNKFNN